MGVLAKYLSIGFKVEATIHKVVAVVAAILAVFVFVEGYLNSDVLFGLFRDQEEDKRKKSYLYLSLFLAVISVFNFLDFKFDSYFSKRWKALI